MRWINVRRNMSQQLGRALGSMQKILRRIPSDSINHFVIFVDCPGSTQETSSTTFAHFWINGSPHSVRGTAGEGLGDLTLARTFSF